MIIILVFTWKCYTSINSTTLKVFKKDKWRFFFFLRSHCNFVNAFHFYHKAAKLYDAGLIFQHFIYVALQVYKYILFVIHSIKGDEVSWANTDAWTRSDLEWPKKLDPMENHGMNSTTLKICICPFVLINLISRSEVEYCTFNEGSKILHSVRWYQYCGMAKQPEEGGIWDGGRTGASFGTGTRFRHGGGLEDLLLPDGITSTGSTQEEVILALCH